MSESPLALHPPLEPDCEPARVVQPVLGLELDLPALERAQRVAAALPAPDELPPGSWIALRAGRAAETGLIARLLTRKHRLLPLAVRCSALLFRGYTDVCADESGTAFGRTRASE